MRIIIDLQGAQTESRFRGIGRYALSFALAVARNRGNHEVFIALSGFFPDTIEPVRAAFDGIVPQENIRVWHAPGPVMESALDNYIRRQNAELIREAFLSSLRPDIIHITSLFEGYIDNAITSIGRIDKSTPVSISLYDLIPLLNPKQYLNSNRTYTEYYQRKIEHLNKAVVYLAISEFSRQEALSCLDISEDRVINVSTAIEAWFKPVSIEEDAALELRKKFHITRPFILYTGGADERKNLPRLILAFAALPDSLRKEHQLLLAGKMHEASIADLKRQAKMAGINVNELIFTGYVTDEELVMLYNLCELFVFPSWHEGFGLPALEAMACGAPVVGANTSSLPEVINLDAALFDPFDVNSIADTMAKALKDNSFRNTLREHGLQQSNYFSWEKSAIKAIATWELLQKPKCINDVIDKKSRLKPKLAFVSPLPPERTGIADYSAELLPALAEYYEINVVVIQNQVDDSWINQNLKVRDIQWLRDHASEIDRVIYQIGNSPFHQHMLPLLRDIPGVVVLHDFYLSSLMAWYEQVGGAGIWTKALYLAHGYGAVRDRFLDAETAKQKYPVNFEVLQRAQGLIVHSEYSRELAWQWYGKDSAAEWKAIPLVRSPVNIDKATARKQLGLNEDDFVICSFGFLDSTKLNHRLLQAWLRSSLAADKKCLLIFVGENHGGDYGSSLLQSIQSSGLGDRIRITGFAPPKIFQQYLSAADLAVQLRTRSRGETSAAVLDCMSHALPVIVNANGSIAELDKKAVWMLTDEFDDAELIEALEVLWRDSEKRHNLGERASDIIQNQHSPEKCAQRYADAIELFYRQAETKAPTLINAITTQKEFNLGDSELLSLAQNLSATLSLPRPAKSLFLDISSTCRNGLNTGIERVARALLSELLNSPPTGYRIEPIYLSDVGGKWHHRYARSYTLKLLGCPSESLVDETAELECGDVLLTLDLSDVLIQAVNAGLFAGYRDRGIAIYSLVFDLLPLRLPQVFPPSADIAHAQWLQAVSTFDGVLGISKAVADDFSNWRIEAGCDEQDRRPFRTGWFHLGADVHNSAPSFGMPDNADWVLSQLLARPSFLMVGTIEPRKAYLQTIEAFSQLWHEGADINLVIVGSEGWKGLSDEIRRDIPKTINCLKNHPEINKHLFWLEGISDEYLEKLYAASTCLIAASYGEGFGLPLIEAAQHKLPIIARDIPVFREVAGEYPTYFGATDGKGLAYEIHAWLKKWQSKFDFNSKELSYMSWKQSTAAVIDFIFGRNRTDSRVSDEVRKKAMDEHLNLIHGARVHMVSTLLPPGDVILDLGGANCPVYKMGYPHRFKKLYLIDLPPAERHDMYKDVLVDPNCAGGEVVIRYGDMTELEDFPDESVDFVWSGQSIEHIPLEKGEKMCRAAYRVLKSGGTFCLDTPNRLVTQIHTRDIGGGFIHPEHCLEYTPAQLQKMLEDAGFEIKNMYGICEMRNTLERNEFRYEDFLLGNQITKQINDGYIQFFHCQKP